MIHVYTHAADRETAPAFLALDSFTQGYVVCALWADGNADSLAGGEGDCEGTDAAFEDIAPVTIAAMIADCKSFQAQADGLLSAYIKRGRDREHAGHDFWLSRCGHGTGFWDRGHGKLGERLHAIAKAFGSPDLYRGDDGLIYFG